MITSPVHATRIVVRTSKADSAFLYSLLEAHEGLTAYSTLEFKNADPHRDVVLFVPPGSEADMRKLLQDLDKFVEIIS